MSRYPFSSGDAWARTAVPRGACDCHIHVYHHRIPAAPGARLLPPDASLEDYRLIQTRMGTSRAVVVTPSTYGTDNRLMLEALSALGPAGRGVAVIGGQESDEQLELMHQQGVRGIRVNLSLGVTHGADAIERLALRIASLGWHVQLLAPAEQLLALEPMLRNLPVDLVLDHFARISPDHGDHHAAHGVVLDLLHQHRVWIKLSGGYLVSRRAVTEDPALDDLARSFIEAAPDRVVWGSDWPHASASAGHQPMPDDASQIDQLARWAGDQHQVERILVTNPERLYGFAPI